MKQIGLVLMAGALALAGCKKKENAGGGSGSAPGTGSEVGTGSGSAPGTGSAAGTGSAPAAPDPKLVERGKYLTTVMGCVMCHTPMGPGMQPDMAKAFAGGLEVPEDFGTWRSPNITPDPDTGIGKWTDDQIIAAVRDGKRPDGSMIKAIMPYMFYTAMTDDDAKAVVAFLRALPPVKNQVAKSELKLPDMPAPQIPRVDVADDPVKHGQYLATLMHCAMCHTPFGPNGPDMSKQFAGGFEMKMPPGMGTGQIFSPNITSDEETGIGKWSAEDVATTLKTMVRPDKRPIVGPMMFYAPLWSQLTDADLAAIGAYVKAIPPVKNKVPPTTFKLNGPPPGGEAGGGGPPPAEPPPPPAEGSGKSG